MYKRQEQVLAGQAAGNGFEHGQAAHAGIKDADGQGSWGIHDVPSMGTGAGGPPRAGALLGQKGAGRPCLPVGRAPLPLDVPSPP